MEINPLANMLPMIQGEEWESFKADIAKNGIKQPVMVHEGAIIDGRNRWKACQELNLDCPITEWDGHGSILDYIISCNLERRHLTPSQRAAFAAEALPLFERELKEKERLRKSGKLTMANLPQSKGLARDHAARALHTSGRAVQDAKKIQEKSPELFERVKAGEKTVNEALSELQGKPHVSHNSGENEWYTPPDIIEAARKVMGEIDLDPASSSIANKIVKAKKFFTSADDGLSHKWVGRVWLNPPYSQPLITQFAEAVVNEYKSNRITQACILVNNATETNWFQSMNEQASALLLLKSRVKFVNQKGEAIGAPLQGQIILYFGNNVAEFETVFKDKGQVMIHA
ncbi:MAG: ParB N-terminal domain-containing protein [Proteobacteria bacterium]|nr:ParB N-terminal domain-containing protein [Pseudomonadota bacterium]